MQVNTDRHDMTAIWIEAGMPHVNSVGETKTDYAIMKRLWRYALVSRKRDFK